MADRDNKGRFTAGNKASSKGPEYKSLRMATKEELMRVAHSLTKPWSTIKKDLEKPNATRLEYLMAKAVSNEKFQFIQWALEMAIGKPKQTIEADASPEAKRLLIDLSAANEKSNKEVNS